MSVGGLFVQNRRIPHTNGEGYGALSALPTDFAEGARITLEMTIDNQQVTKSSSLSLSIFVKERD